MSKYVKCVSSSGWSGALTEDSCYKVLSSDGLNYLITSDEGVDIWFECERFEEPYELPEPITFKSQEEFENAVMAVVMGRLEVFSYSTDEWGNELQEKCAMRDDK